MEKVKEFKKDGFDIQVFTECDEYSDTSWIGEYTDDLEDGVIVRQYGKYYEDLIEEERENILTHSREFRGFKPYAGGEKVGTPEYKKYGQQDYKRMEGLNNGDWSFLGAIVRAYKKGIELGEGSLWGIESDCGEEYLQQIIEELTSEAIADAKNNLKALCESDDITIVH